MEFHSTTEKNKQSKIEKSWLTTNTWKTEKKNNRPTATMNTAQRGRIAKKEINLIHQFIKQNLNNNKLINN